MKGSDPMLAWAEAYWKLFEQTGAIGAYMIYRKMVLQ